MCADDSIGGMPQDGQRADCAGNKQLIDVIFDAFALA
jgi:hypothetical protein